MNQFNNQPVACSHQDVAKYIYFKAQSRVQSLVCQECKARYEYDNRYLKSFNDITISDLPYKIINLQLFNIKFKISSILDELKAKTKHLLQSNINAIKGQNDQQINKESYFAVYDILKADGSEIKIQLFYELAKFLQPYQVQQNSQLIDIPCSTIFLQNNNQSQIINRQEQRINPINGQQNNNISLQLRGNCSNASHLLEPLKYISIDKNDDQPLKCQSCIGLMKQKYDIDAPVILPINELTLDALNLMYNSKIYQTFDIIEERSFTLLNEGHLQIKQLFQSLIQAQDRDNFKELIKIIDSNENFFIKFLSIIKKDFEQLGNKQVIKFHKCTYNIDSKSEVVYKNNQSGNMVLIKLETLFVRYRLRVKNNQSIFYVGVTNIDTVDWNKFLEEKDKKRYFYMISQKGRIYSLQNGNREGHQKDDQWSAYKFEDSDQLIEIIDRKVKLFLGNQTRQINNYTFKDVEVSRGDFLCLYFTGENEIELEQI